LIAVEAVRAVVATLRAWPIAARIEAYAGEILALVEATPDMTLAEIAAHLESEHGLRVSQSKVWRFFERRGVTKKTAQASEQQRPDVLRRRRAWFEAQPDRDPQTLVFIDETGASTKMARRCGRAPRGRRCRASVPHGHCKTTTFVAALRLDGMTAPMVLDGAMHGVAFPAYVEPVLVPTVLQVGRMDGDGKDQAECIDEEMALLAFDLLARVIARQIDARVPFSELFTLWLSITAALGEA